MTDIVSPRNRRASEGRVLTEPKGVTDRTQLVDPRDVGLDAKLYWPSIVPVHEILPAESRLGSYYLYYSASHHENASIRLAYAERPLGPYVDHGAVFRDETGGDHTETPEVVWNVDTERFHLYYHAFIGSDGSQTTGLAFSEDGLNWEKHGVVIDGYGTTPGNRHTGYARVHRFGGRWIAHHLMGGGGSAGFGVSYSADGIEWTTDPRRLTNGSDLTDDPNRRIAWSHTRVLVRDGCRWWIGTEGPITWGGNPAGKRVVCSPFLDERSIVEQPDVLVDPAVSWEGNTTYTPDTLIEDGTVYLFYATRTEDGGSIGGARIVWSDDSDERSTGGASDAHS